jgi:hypothetical protein
MLYQLRKVFAVFLGFLFSGGSRYVYTVSVANLGATWRALELAKMGCRTLALLDAGVDLREGPADLGLGQGRFAETTTE